MIKRYGIVRVKDSDEPRLDEIARQVARYMPESYQVDGVVKDMTDFGARFSFGIVFSGRDVAGWTLDGYVIPRLASGNYAAEEIDLSHPAMRQIPAPAEATG